MKLLKKDTYIAFIKGSISSRSYQKNFAKIGDRKVNIVENGRLSCAFFVSSVLKVFGFIKNLHTTVEGTIKDMRKSGWYEIKRPKIGAVILWEKNNGNKHLGFYIGKQKAVSNSKLKQVPRMHHWTYGQKNKQPKRAIEKIFWSDLIKN